MAEALGPSADRDEHQPEKDERLNPCRIEYSACGVGAGGGEGHRDIRGEGGRLSLVKGAVVPPYHNIAAAALLEPSREVEHRAEGKEQGD